MVEELVRPILTVDIVLLCLRLGQVHVVLQRRAKPPHEGKVALMGGYVHPDEDGDAAAAARRVLKQKGHVTVRLLEQLMTFSGPDRDARGWSTSIAYYGLLPEAELPKYPPVPLEIIPLRAAVGLPFDHDRIIAAAADRLRRRSSYSSLPAYFLSETFTLSQLREAYRASLGRTLNDSAFRRKIEELRLLEPMANSVSKATARPAQLYRLARPGVTEFDRTL